MAWLLEHLIAGSGCDACANRACHRAHLIPKSRGGDDRGNVVLLCSDCHRRQEKRTEAFIQECRLDLFWKAKFWTRRYDAERGLPF